MKKVNIKSIKPIQDFIREIEDFVQAMIQHSSGIKAKIQEEAENVNYLPKTTKLPI